MCLETSKQAYAFLHALDEAGPDGLTYVELMSKMEEISKEEFESDVYVSAPVPLMTMLRRHKVSKGVTSTGAGAYRITELGSRGLSLLTSVAIEPRRSRLAESVSH